jgi:hypothetical protein
MNTLQRRAVIVGISVMFLFRFAPNIRADILFKGKQPLKIGLGKLIGAKINWTNCSGKDASTYDAPPYFLDEADNCSVGPPSFGLQCEGESCTVVDETKLRKYLPEGVKVYNGEGGFRLRIEEHSVDLEYKTSPASAAYTSSVHLER